MDKIKSYIRLARPHQWIKNVVVLFPVIFGLKMAQPMAWFEASLTAFMFCVASSFIYVINDIVDAPADRRHPLKKNRPVASGKITVRQACFEGLFFLIITAVLGLLVNRVALAVLVLYLMLQIAYTLLLKSFVLVDVICISIGFVLRAVAGAVAISVWVSPWLFICMFTIFLFMGFCKRMNEIVLFDDLQTAQQHRNTLLHYSPQLLTHLITTSSAIAIVSFLLYSLNPATVIVFGTNYFIFTLPIIVYAIFRFAMVSMQGIYSGPTEIILKDRAFEIATFLWALCIVLLIIYGKEISDYLNVAG